LVNKDLGHFVVFRIGIVEAIYSNSVNPMSQLAMP